MECLRYYTPNNDTTTLSTFQLIHFDVCVCLILESEFSDTSRITDIVFLMVMISLHLERSREHNKADCCHHGEDDKQETINPVRQDGIHFII